MKSKLRQADRCTDCESTCVFRTHKNAPKQLTFSPRILLDDSLRDEVAQSLKNVLQSWSLADIFKPEFPSQSALHTPNIISVLTSPQERSDEDYSVSFQRDTQGKLLDGRDMTFGTKALAPGKFDADELLLHQLTGYTAQINAQLTYLLSELIAGNFAQHVETTTVVQYSPRYRLSFSLLNEDASSQGYASGWDIEEVLASSYFYSLQVETKSEL